MAREKCLKKSFKDSLEDIKERMKEKRNKKLAKLGRSYALGKPNAVLSAKGKIGDDSSLQLKNVQANNRALALALEEEKGKMREAQDIILYQKREYQLLKFQMLILQRKVELQQEKEHAETKLLSVKKIISKAVQNLLEATNLLGSAKDLGTTEDTMCVPAVEECDSNIGRNQTTMTLLNPDFTVDRSKQGKTFTSEIKDMDMSYLDSGQDVENIPIALEQQAKKGWQSSSHKDYQPNESRNISSNEENEQVGNSLPKSVSTRRRCLKFQNQSEFSVFDGNSLDITDQIKESCEQDRTRPEKGLEKSNEQYEDTHLCEENIDDGNKNQNVACFHVLVDSITSTTDSKESDFNNNGDSQTQKERGQKRKLEVVKNRSKTRSKKKNQSTHSCSKGKTVPFEGSNDAYDFVVEESVHITPFRQNKENENIVSTKNDLEETSSDSFTSDDDSEDSSYEPYKNKSKIRKTLSCGNDAAPVHRRTRSKMTGLEQHEKTTEGENWNTENKQSIGKHGHASSVTEQNSGTNVIMKVAEDVPCSIPTVVDKGKQSKMRSSSENTSFKTDTSSESLHKFCHLGDITNLKSTSAKPRDSHPPIATGEKDLSQSRRRCTISMSYKEPSINKKLRRGDPFTDTGFLNSPIFKEKKSCKYKSVKKKSLSRYNEAFVGCL